MPQHEGKRELSARRRVGTKRICVLLALSVALFCSRGHAQDVKRDLLFDLAHGQLFSPFRDGDLDYSVFASMFKHAGVPMRSTSMRVNATVLRDVSAYVISGPFQDVDPDEIMAIRDFVAEGGRVIVLLHISQPVARLAQAFGLVVSTVPVHERDEDKLIDHSSTDFMVTPDREHEILQGVGSIDFYGSFALLPEGKDVQVLAMTSGTSFADLNGTNVFDEGDVSQPFCVMAVATRGKGSMLILGDDALLSNAFISKADNGLLAANIVRWARGNAGFEREERNNRE